MKPRATPQEIRDIRGSRKLGRSPLKGLSLFSFLQRCSADSTEGYYSPARWG